MEDFPDVSLVGLGTAVARHRIPQAGVLRLLTARLGADSAAAALAQRIFAVSEVHERWSVLPDFSGTGAPELFGPGENPGTEARMRAHRVHAPPLAAAACRRALATAGIAADRVTHLVVVTCTGFAAPGVDAELVSLLGLRPGVRRTSVGFMGCFAAFNGLRVAHDAVAADPRACALMVCVELCTLHFRPDPRPDNLVAHALFGDGAAACVVARAPADRALATWGSDASLLLPAGAGDMGWEIGDDGFRMRLSPGIPDSLAREIDAFARRLAGGDPVDSWCVHPGGRAILDRAAVALGLSQGALESSRSVLRSPGNVSSGTVLFVLQRELARMSPGERGVMLGFGPGLTMEGRAFVRAKAPLDPLVRCPRSDDVRPEAPAEPVGGRHRGDGQTDHRAPAGRLPRLPSSETRSESTRPSATTADPQGHVRHPPGLRAGTRAP